MGTIYTKSTKMSGQLYLLSCSITLRVGSLSHFTLTLSHSAEDLSAQHFKGRPYRRNHRYSLGSLHMYLAEKSRPKPPICTV